MHFINFLSDLRNEKRSINEQLKNSQKEKQELEQLRDKLIGEKKILEKYLSFSIKRYPFLSTRVKPD